jgi:hypothetical protein
MEQREIRFTLLPEKPKNRQKYKTRVFKILDVRY